MNKGYVSHLGSPPWDGGRNYFRTHGKKQLALTILESPDGLPSEQIYWGITNGDEKPFRIEMPLEEYVKRCEEYASLIRERTVSQP